MPPPLVIALVLVALAVLGYFAWRAEQLRREALCLWAASRGFTFRAARDGELGRRYPDFKVLQRGRNRSARCVMTGRRSGHAVTAFDYQYVTGHGKNRRTHRLSAVIVRCAHPLIPLRIRREHVFDRVGEFFGYDDIDFESAEFSRKFHVTSPDRKWAYDVLHNRAIDFLLRECFCDLEFDNWHVMAYRDHRFSPEEFGRAIELAVGLLEQIPAYAVQELTGETADRRRAAHPPQPRER